VRSKVERRKVLQDTALDDYTRLRVVRFFPELTNSAGLTFLAALRQSFPFRIRQVQTDNDATFTNWDHGRPEDRAGQVGPVHPCHHRLYGGGDHLLLHPAPQPPPERGGRAEPPNRW